MIGDVEILHRLAGREAEPDQGFVEGGVDPGRAVTGENALVP